VGSRIMASGRRFFLVKWAAKYGPEAKNSWEPEDNLTAMLIEEWEDKVSHRYVRVPGGTNTCLIQLNNTDLGPIVASTMHYLGSELQRQMGIGISLFKMGRSTSRMLIVDLNMPAEVCFLTLVAHARRCSDSLSRQSCRLLRGWRGLFLG